MTCKEYEEWEKKWSLKYLEMRTKTEGSSQDTEALLQVTCSCQKAIFTVSLPTEFLYCPSCKAYVRYRKMKTCWKPKYVPLEAPLRKYMQKGYYRLEWTHKEAPYLPVDKVYIPISDVPRISERIREICGRARDVRFDETTRNRAVNREHQLLRKGVLDGSESVENLLGTMAYLAELVPAWMFVTNQYYKNVKNTLEKILEDRKTLLELLETEDSAKIQDCMGRIRTRIDHVVMEVKKKIK